MANWSKILSRGNVEDRRSFAPVTATLSLTGVAFIVLFNYLTGGNILDVIQQIETLPVQQHVVNTGEFEGEDSYEVFASTVLGSNDEHWRETSQLKGFTYTPPRLVLFRTATTSSCGTATSQVGPHYCSLDQTIYLDETFFDELTRYYGAQGGDLAEAYVIAHEVGHHVQQQLGIFDRARPQDKEASVRLELQADCFAGLWASSIKDLGVLEPGEIREAMDAAAAVGDDRIQEKATGYVNPETWTHGSSEQRVNAFMTGYESGQYDRCATLQ